MQVSSKKTKLKKSKTKKAFRDKVKKIVKVSTLNIKENTKLKNEANNKIKIKSKNSFNKHRNTEKNRNTSNIIIERKAIPKNKYPEVQTKREKNMKKCSESSALPGFKQNTKKVNEQLVTKKSNHSQLGTSPKKHIVQSKMREGTISRESMPKKHEKGKKGLQTKLVKALSKSTQLITKKYDSVTSTNAKILKPEKFDLTSKIKKNKKALTLRERMVEKLKAAKFRYINEQIYTNDSKEISKYFREDKEAFDKYHEGYRQQVGKWPMNPLDVIIKSINKL